MEPKKDSPNLTSVLFECFRYVTGPIRSFVCNLMKHGAEASIKRTLDHISRDYGRTKKASVVPVFSEADTVIALEALKKSYFCAEFSVLSDDPKGHQYSLQLEYNMILGDLMNVQDASLLSAAYYAKGYHEARLALQHLRSIEFLAQLVKVQETQSIYGQLPDSSGLEELMTLADQESRLTERFMWLRLSLHAGRELELGSGAGEPGLDLAYSEFMETNHSVDLNCLRYSALLPLYRAQRSIEDQETALDQARRYTQKLLQVRDTEARMLIAELYFEVMIHLHHTGRHQEAIEKYRSIPMPRKLLACHRAELLMASALCNGALGELSTCLQDIDAFLTLSQECSPPVGYPGFWEYAYELVGLVLALTKSGDLPITGYKNRHTIPLSPSMPHTSDRVFLLGHSALSLTRVQVLVHIVRNRAFRSMHLRVEEVLRDRHDRNEILTLRFHAFCLAHRWCLSLATKQNGAAHISREEIDNAWQRAVLECRGAAVPDIDEVVGYRTILMALFCKP